MAREYGGYDGSEYKQPGTEGESAKKNYYEILGVSPKATEGEIKKAWINFLKNNLHEDQIIAMADGPEKDAAAARFEAAKQAFATLSTAKPRAAYDMKNGTNGYESSKGSGSSSGKSKYENASQDEARRKAQAEADARRSKAQSEAERQRAEAEEKQKQAREEADKERERKREAQEEENRRKAESQEEKARREHENEVKRQQEEFEARQRQEQERENQRNERKPEDGYDPKTKTWKEIFDELHGKNK